jgi:prepilin-type N-terminal cleavage/methylation domain-containing protein
MERRKMKKKGPMFGFTLVELLVVIAIIAMLLAILMPALGKVRQLAQRIMCSTNLAGLGKAMLTYSNDDKYESFPVGGGSSAYWDRGVAGGTNGKAALRANKITYDWRIPSFVDTTAVKYTSISSCLYLLVKIADTTPDQFICPGSDNKKFELSNFEMPSGTQYQSLTFTDVWDFGNAADTKTSFTMGKGHVTYSYQSPMPISTATSAYVYPITTTSNPARPVMADRNPFWTYGNQAYMYNWDGAATSNKPYQASLQQGNNIYHQKDGQNVLYADLHVKFEKQANIGIQQDNIYTYWGTSTLNGTADEYKRQCGKGATSGQETAKTPFEGAYDQTQGQSGQAAPATSVPTNEEDSYLISDIDNYIK